MWIPIKVFSAAVGIQSDQKEPNHVKRELYIPLRTHAPALCSNVFLNISLHFSNAGFKFYFKCH